MPNCDSKKHESADHPATVALLPRSKQPICPIRAPKAMWKHDMTGKIHPFFSWSAVVVLRFAIKKHGNSTDAATFDN